MIEKGGEPADQFTRLQPRFLDLFAWKPGRVRQFGVIVISENIRERLGRRRVRVDVRVRVNQRQLFEFIEQPAFELVAHERSQ